MTGNIVIQEMFAEFQNRLTSKDDVREVIRKICKQNDRISYQISTVLQVIHNDEESIGPACLKAREMFEKAREGYLKLKEAVPKAEYSRYADHWRCMTQRFCCHILLTIWLEAGLLARHETVSQILGIESKRENGFHLDLEEYLVGLIMLCTELSRLAVNSAGRGEYTRTMQIYKFVMEVNAGFRLLNIKTDHLRKSYEFLKSDVDKIEEIVYDISLRRLLDKPGPEGDGEKVIT